MTEKSFILIIVSFYLQSTIAKCLVNAYLDQASS